MEGFLVRYYQELLYCVIKQHFIRCLVLVQCRKTGVKHSELNICFVTGLPRSGKKFWKMKKIPGQGKVREFHFQSGKFRKMKKSHGKVRNFKIFQIVAS